MDLIHLESLQRSHNPILAHYMRNCQLAPKAVAEITAECLRISLAGSSIDEARQKHQRVMMISRNAAQ